MNISMPKTPVFFIATRFKDRPVKLGFYTGKGQPVAFEDVQKVKTKHGIQLFVRPRKAKPK
jgi:hypothetical protein